MVERSVCPATKQIHVNVARKSALFAACRSNHHDTCQWLIHTICILDGQAEVCIVPAGLVVDCHVVRIVTRCGIELLDLIHTRIVYVVTLLDGVLCLDEAECPHDKRECKHTLDVHGLFEVLVVHVLLDIHVLSRKTSKSLVFDVNNLFISSKIPIFCIICIFMLENTASNRIILVVTNTKKTIYKLCLRECIAHQLRRQNAYSTTRYYLF